MFYIIEATSSYGTELYDFVWAPTAHIVLKHLSLPGRRKIKINLEPLRFSICTKDWNNEIFIYDCRRATVAELRRKKQDIIRDRNRIIYSRPKAEKPADLFVTLLDIRN